MSHFSINRENYYRFGEYFFATCGGIYLCTDILHFLISPNGSLCRFSIFLGTAFLGGMFFFLYNGFYREGFLKRSETIKSISLCGTTIEVCQGDLFKEDGWWVVSVSEFFDSRVDGMIVAKKSIHGTVLQRYFKDDLLEWDRTVVKNLEGKGITLQLPEKRQDSQAKNVRYPIGSTVVMSKNSHHFLFVALTRIDLATDQALATPSDLSQALRGVLREARKCCAREPLVIPLIGSGLGRVKMHPNMLLHYIIQEIFEESSSSKITDAIKIVIHPNDFEKIDLSIVKKLWST